MNAPQIADSLRRIFAEEKPRIVFWHDANREFEESLANIVMDGVTLLRLDQIGALELKIRLEMEDPHGSYLIYAPFPQPEQDNDWLLDIRLYSRSFYADIASIILDELGLTRLSMREHISQRIQFFRSQERLKHLKKWVSPTDLETELDRKLIAVLARAEQPETFSILMKLFGEFCQQDGCDLKQQPRSWIEIEKYGLATPFWDLMALTFGYVEESPSLSNLLIKLLATDFNHTLKAEVPQALRHFLLPNKKLALNATVFLSQWRGHVNYYSGYNLLARNIENEMRIADHLIKLDETSLAEVMTFEAVERHIARCLRDHLINNTSSFDIDEMRAIIAQRRDGHWASMLLGESGSDKINYYRAIYDAIEAAAELLLLRRKYADGFIYPNAKAMYEAYIGELFRFDQLYRLFHEAADQVELQGWDILKSLREVIENCYSNWCINQMAARWGDFVDRADNYSLLHNWRIEGARNQQEFYRVYVEPLLNTSAQSKVYVIVSDAFRYEAAEELVRELNGKNRLMATLSAQLGVLPSYTALGMAALLPHETLDYKATAGLDVLVDGQPTATLEQRAKILEKFQGTAIKAEELLAMNRDQSREFVRPWRIIYIYHNKVDAIGDTLSTESNTFSAVRAAIKELSSLARLIINNLNGSQILITADHGFLFQETYPSYPDKSELEYKPPGTLKAKKRYLIGMQLGAEKNVWHGRIDATAGIAGAMEFWIPRGANRFHFVGGARFVHGGAMLQEIVVPVIFVKELHGQAADRAAIRKVDVSLLGSTHRVVNNVQRFNFIQTDAVSERVQPRTLLISLRDGDVLISNEIAITFDNTAITMEERKKAVQLIVKAGQYDKKKDYAMVLRDADTQIEYQRIPVTIDLAFMNDF